MSHCGQVILGYSDIKNEYYSFCFDGEITNHLLIIKINKYLLSGAPIAQLGECQTLDHKVAGLILTQGAVLCP